MGEGHFETDNALSGAGIGVCRAPVTQESPTVTRIEVPEAAQLCTACTAGFVDARSASAFEQGHISGAIHLPPIGHSDEEAAIQKLRTFPKVIVYDGDQECALAQRVAERLTRHGLKDVRGLAGAWQAWADAGAPALSGACDVCGHDDDHGPSSSP